MHCLLVACRHIIITTNTITISSSITMTSAAGAEPADVIRHRRKAAKLVSIYRTLVHFVQLAAKPGGELQQVAPDKMQGWLKEQLTAAVQHHCSTGAARMVQQSCVLCYRFGDTPAGVSLRLHIKLQDPNSCMRLWRTVLLNVVGQDKVSVTAKCLSLMWVDGIVMFWVSDYRNTVALCLPISLCMYFPQCSPSASHFNQA